MLIPVAAALSFLLVAAGSLLVHPLLLSAACLGLSAIVLCLWIDLDRLARYAGGLPARVSLRGSGVALTQPGRRLRAGIDVLRCCRNLSGCAAERRQLDVPEVSDEELLSRIHLDLAAGPAEGQSFYQQLLAITPRFFRAGAAAVILEPDEARAAWQVFEHGCGSRLRLFLQSQAQELSSAGEGQHDHGASDSLLADFTLFGYPHTISIPFAAPGPGRAPRRGLLWLGYGPLCPPLEFEAERARRLAGKIEKELHLALRVHELTRQVQQAQHAVREKGEYLSHISHDIRSPLNNIRSILSLMKVESKDPAASDLIDVGLGNCLHLSEIVEDILDYSKHQAGRLTAHPEAVDLAECAEDVVESFSVAARLKGLRLELQLAARPCQSWVDRRHLKRVLANLVSNAIKYTPGGRVDVTVADRGGQCRITVRDTGIGMTEQQLQMLFVPFQRMAHTVAEGAGLGMALSKILVSLNGGTIRAASQYRVGSEIELVFPLHRQPVVFRLSERAPAYGDSAEILLVDDNSDFLTTLARNLGTRGFRTQSALTVAEALDLCNFARPAAVVSDASMPGGGAEALLDGLPAMLRPMPPLIVLSGRDPQAIGERFKRKGAFAVLAKPIDVTRLEKVLRDAMAAAPAVRAVGE